MLKEALEDALARGEKLRNDIVKEILNSQIFTDLANNPRFINAVARVIRSKDEVARSLQAKLKELIKMMNIPNRERVKDFERRVDRIEKVIESLGRKIIMKQASQTAGKRQTHRKTRIARRKSQG